MARDEDLTPSCCGDGLSLLRELPNDQKADPGWRHVRAEITSRGFVHSIRVRFCPFCGTAFREKDDWLTLKNIAAWCRSRRVRLSIKYEKGKKVIVVSAVTRHILPRFGKRFGVEVKGPESTMEEVLGKVIDEMNREVGGTVDD